MRNKEIIIILDKVTRVYLSTHTTVKGFANSYGLSDTQYSYICDIPWNYNEKKYKNYIIVKDIIQ